MSTYIISYDLSNNRDYESLYEAIKAYGTWAHITESTWAVVSSNSSAVDIRDDLKRTIDSDDKLFVIKSGIEAAWVNVICRNEWLKENL
jgi:hypothetical protein